MSPAEELLVRLNLNASGTHLSDSQIKLLWSSICNFMNCKLCDFVLVDNNKYQIPTKSLAYLSDNFNKEELVKYMLWHQLTFGSNFLTVLPDRDSYFKFLGEFDEPNFFAVTEMNSLLDRSAYLPFTEFKVAENMLQLEQMSYCTLLAMWHLKLSKTNMEHRRLSKYYELIKPRLDALSETNRTKIKLKGKLNDTNRNASKASRTKSIA